MALGRRGGLEEQAEEKGLKKAAGRGRSGEVNTGGKEKGPGSFA